MRTMILGLQLSFYKIVILFTLLLYCNTELNKLVSNYQSIRLGPDRQPNILSPELGDRKTNVTTQSISKPQLLKSLSTSAGKINEETAYSSQ